MFIFYQSVIYGQEIKLNVISFNPCGSIYKNELLVLLIKNNRTFQITDSIGTFQLPEAGKYQLKVLLKGVYRLSDSVKVIKIHEGQNYDTLARATIVDCAGPVHGPDCGYFCCDKLCEGYNVDYYDNGKKKIEGRFKKGYPIGQLIFYNADGRKKEILYYDKAGKGKLLKKSILN